MVLALWEYVRDVYWVFRPMRLSALVVLVGGIGLAWPPQSVDSLVAMADDGRLWDWGLLTLTAIWWAVNAWYWARLSGRMHFGAPPPLKSRAHWLVSHRQLRLAHWRAHLPRAIGALAFLGVAAALVNAWAAQKSEGNVSLLGAALGMVLLALLGYRLAVRRRRIAGWLESRLRAVQTPSPLRLGLARIV
ncbi:MAG: hypothetical protein K2Q10_00720, partial [Rhodospirillales bacterium]|nr:hypothetical protein [Rhodospirillales bacterium]